MGQPHANDFVTIFQGYGDNSAQAWVGVSHQSGLFDQPIAGGKDNVGVIFELAHGQKG